MSSFNELAYLILEKKATADYRKSKFLKKYKYDPKTKSIEMDGKRFPFKYTGGSKKHTTLPQGGARAPKPNQPGTGGMSMNRAAFNMKHPKAHEVIASHEFGHMMDNSIGPGSEKDKIKQDVYKDIESSVKDVKTKHGRRPQEYVADAVAYQRSGDKAFNAQAKESIKILNKRYKKNITKRKTRDALVQEINTRKNITPKLSNDSNFGKHLSNMKSIEFPGV